MTVLLCSLHRLRSPLLLAAIFWILSGLLASSGIAMGYESHHSLSAMPASQESGDDRQSKENLQGDDTDRSPNDGGPITVAGVELLGVATFATGTEFAGTEIGGLSGITYDPVRDVYYVVSDDRGADYPSHFYTIDIDLSDGLLQDGDVTFQSVTTLLDQTGAPFKSRIVDAESIELVSDGQVAVASEGRVTSSKRMIDPFIIRFDLNGEQIETLPIPDRYLPSSFGISGAPNNRGFEGLAITPDGQYLYAASEAALVQDEPAEDVDQVGPARVLQYRLDPVEPLQEHVYIPGMPPPNVERSAGLTALSALDNHGTFLALERPYATSLGSRIAFRLFETSTQGASDTSGIKNLQADDASFVSMHKRLVLDFADLGIRPENREGMALGPQLPDGRQVLIVVSDNNFNRFQVTQFVALALDLEPAPAR